MSSERELLAVGDFGLCERVDPAHKLTRWSCAQCLYVIAMYAPSRSSLPEIDWPSALTALTLPRSFVPPLAVAMRMGHGVSGCDVIINILLWILGACTSSLPSSRRAGADPCRARALLAGFIPGVRAFLFALNRWRARTDWKKATQVIHAFWLVSKSFKYAPRTQVVYQQQPIVHGGAPAGYGTAGYGAAPARY